MLMRTTITGQGAALSVTHDLRPRFDFAIDRELAADIDDHPLDGAAKYPGVPARIVKRNRLTTITPYG